MNPAIGKVIFDPGEIPPASSSRPGWPWEQVSAPIPNSESPSFCWPKITIVTPSFNQGKFLEQTIRSVLLQNYPNVEYIVMDGGSSDNSMQIIEKYRAFFSYCQSESDGGQAHAISEGFKRATGEIYGYLNSDDVLFPGALRHVARAFLRSPKTGVIYGNRKVIDEDGAVIGRHIWPYFLSRYHWARGQPLAQECCFWRQEIYWKVGGIDPNKFFILDYDLFIRMWMVCNFRKTRAYLGAFRIHGESKTARYADVWERELTSARLRYGLQSPGYFRIRMMNRMDHLQVLIDRLLDRVFGSKLPSIE